jgi:hypothetical protein
MITCPGKPARMARMATTTATDIQPSTDEIDDKKKRADDGKTVGAAENTFS